MKHALPLAVRRYPWPSVQRDSELLARRVAAGLRIRMAREALTFYFERLERKAS